MLFISASLDSKQEKTIFLVPRLLCYRTPKNIPCLFQVSLCRPALSKQDKVL